MADSAADQVDLCMGEMVQDVAEDNVSAAEAAALWAESDFGGPPAKHQRQLTEQEPDQPAASSTVRPVLLQQPSSTERALPEQAETYPPKQEVSYPVEQEATPGALVEEYPEAPYPEEQEATPGTSVAEYPEAPYPEQQEATTLPWIPEVPVNPVEAEGMPDPSDKTAASLSKALRKMQAESAVLQEHSRRLQEKAAMIQQQRASADQVKQGQEVFNHGQASEQISDADSLQYSMGAEGDKEAAYQYSDTSMPTQDGGPQWSIGGVPLQQQLRMLAVDNGMGLDEGQEGQGRSTADSDQTGQGCSTADSDQTGQGLQWGAASAAPITISPTKKKVNTGKAVKEAQVGGINSVGALHDARNKQVPLNPLRARKGSVGQAANPVIRQHSMAQQAQAKQARHFTDTLRKRPQQEGAGMGEGSPQAPSSDPQQEPFYPNRALVDVYGSSLASSKSEPHGLYAKGTPKGGYPSHGVAGPPKAASVHEMDMTPSQPGKGPGQGQGQGAGQNAGPWAGASKRRSKAGRNPTSAPGPYAQNWGNPGMPLMGMQGMPLGAIMPGIYNPQGMPHLPQLAHPNMMGNSGMGYGQMGPQQAFGATSHDSGGGLQGRRNMGMTRQAGSALKIPAGNPMMGHHMMAAQPMQQGSFADPYGQNYGALPPGGIPAYPMQYAPPSAAFMGQAEPHMMAGQYGNTMPPMGYGKLHNPGQSSPDRQSKKSRLPGGQTNYMAQAQPAYAAPVPVAYNMQQAGGYRPHGMQGMHYPAMQQRAEAVQQFQMQQYQQMEASVMQQLQQKQDQALLKYGNFDHVQYRQQDLQSRPEFRTY